jgi:hypothetical protein
MHRSRLQCCGDRDACCTILVCERQDFGKAQAPVCQRPGLIEHDMCDARYRFERVSAHREDAATAQCTRRRGQRRRRGE